MLICKARSTKKNGKKNMKLKRENGLVRKPKGKSGNGSVLQPFVGIHGLKDFFISFFADQDVITISFFNALDKCFDKSNALGTDVWDNFKSIFLVTANHFPDVINAYIPQIAEQPCWQRKEVCGCG